MTKFSVALLISFCLAQGAGAEIPTETMQLHQLIEQSQHQIDLLKTILEGEKQDAAKLNEAAGILEKMSVGIRQSIEPYQGTAEYRRAAKDLIELQSANDSLQTYSDSKEVRERALKSSERSASEKDFQNLIHFQRGTVQANQAELAQQSQLQDALRTAGPGFVPKIGAEAALGTWQSTERISAQLTELLSSLSSVREELRAMRLHNDQPGWVSNLLQGAEVQNQRMRTLK